MKPPLKTLTIDETPPFGDIVLPPQAASGQPEAELARRVASASPPETRNAWTLQRLRLAFS